MSLESKIEQLTAAIEKLNANMVLLLTTPANQTVDLPQAAAPVVQEAVKVVEQVAKVTVSADDAQAMCLQLSRKDPANKSKIKAILSEYKAAKVADLSPENLQAFVQKLEQL